MLKPGTADGFMTLPLYFFIDDANRSHAATSTGMYARTEHLGERIALACDSADFERMPQQGAGCCAVCRTRAKPGMGVSKYRHQWARQRKPATHRFANGQPAATLPTSEPVLVNALAGIIFSIQVFISSIDAHYLIATAVQPRYARRCAYTAFPSNLQISEADGHASV
jgi:hypothetical protein